MKEIKLTRNKVALVDDNDFAEVSEHRWCAHKSKTLFYAWRNIQDGGRKYGQFMHYFLMERKKGFVMDHVNHNSLDNRRSNLRYVTHTQNSQNRLPKLKKSNFKGVSWISSRNEWYAQIDYNKKAYYLGSYKIEEHAAEAYNNAAIRLFGEYAYLNELPRQGC